MTTTSPGVYKFGPFRFDPSDARLERDGQPVRLPPKALDLLHALVKKPGHLVTKAELLEEVWAGTFVDEANLSVHISALRKALEDEGENYIETVPRRGYRFVAPLAAGQADEAVPAGSISTPPPRRMSSNIWLAAGLVLVVAIGAATWFTFGSPGRREPPAAAVRSVLIVPMVAAGMPEDQSHLGVGMAQALGVRLMGVEHLRVTPAAMLRRDEDPFAAAARLKTDAVLTGSIQRDGDRLRVVATLVSSVTQQQLWAGRFDDRFTDIFTVQDAIAERIASSLVTDLTATERRRLSRRETASADAYDLYLKGRARWARRTAESIRSAVGLYQEAIKLDANFALAHAGLADAYTISASGLPGRTRFPLAKDAAARALALDHTLAEAHTALAFLAYKADWDWREAERAFTQAIALEPRYALAHHWYGEMLGLLGRAAESAAAFQRARELDPESVAIRADFARMLTRAARAEEALVLIDEGLKIDPGEFRLHRERALALVVLGRDAEAYDHFLKNRVLSGTSAENVALLRAGYAAGGIRGYRGAEVAMQRRQYDAAKVPPVGLTTSMAINYAALGDREAAYEWLDRCADLLEDGVLGLRVNREFDFIRDEPRFQSLLKRVRYP